MAIQTLASPPPKCGERLLSVLIDELAKEDPERPLVSVARGESASDGFEDVSIKTFARAVNRCAWWLEEHIGRSEDDAPIFYIGPSDILYLIILFAAAKTGHIVSISTCSQMFIVLTCRRRFSVPTETSSKPIFLFSNP